MKDGIKAKRPGYIKLYPERWIYGSTREEMTEAQRAVWTDFLCLAYLNDPVGQIDLTSFRRLANQLNVSQKLLMGTIRRAMLNGKIKLIRVIADPKTNEKLEDIELDCVQLDNKVTDLDTSREKVGVPLYAIIILKWNEYQSEYLRQKPYRNAKSGSSENGQNLGPDSVTRVTSKGEERKEEEKKEEEKTENISKISPSHSPLPSPPKEKKTLKEEFLTMLRELQGYPFSESLDALLFDITFKECPGINILEQLQKKITWWRDRPEAIKSDPRAQLKAWFKEEAKFKAQNGPLPIGDIMPEVDDPDQGRFLAQLIAPRKKRPGVEEGGA